MQSVGTVRQLARYPVKSMRGEPLPSATLTLQGIPMDRRYAFVQTASRSGFPWLTARQLSDLLLYQAAVEGDPASPTVTVIAPNGDQFPVASDELRQALESKSGRGLFLLHDDRGSYDSAQVSVISRQTVERVAEESGTAVEPWRFRANLLVDLAGGQAFDELAWVGRTVRIGAGARIAITGVDHRCVIITLDPATGKSSPSVLKCVVEEHGRRAGVYGSVLTPGDIRAGDPVTLED